MPIFVRIPESCENIANLQLIELGPNIVDVKVFPRDSKTRASAEDRPEKSEIMESSSGIQKKKGKIYCSCLKPIPTLLLKLNYSSHLTGMRRK